VCFSEGRSERVEKKAHQRRSAARRTERKVVREREKKERSGLQRGKDEEGRKLVPPMLFLDGNIREMNRLEKGNSEGVRYRSRSKKVARASDRHTHSSGGMEVEDLPTKKFRFVGRGKTSQVCKRPWGFPENQNEQSTRPRKETRP